MPSSNHFTISNFVHIAEFLAADPDDIVSLASTCRDACEACDSETVWSLVVFYFFDEILPGHEDIIRNLVNKREFNRVLKITKRLRNEDVSDDDEDVLTNSTPALPIRNAPLFAPPLNPQTGSARAAQRRRNNANNVLSSSAIQTNVVKIVLPDGEQKEIVIDPNMPHRNTFVKCDAIDGTVAAETRKLISERLLPSILFSCPAYVEFQVRALQATPFVSRFSIKTICEMLDELRISFKNLENDAQQFSGISSYSRNARRQRQGVPFNPVLEKLLDGNTDHLISVHKALFQDQAYNFLKHERSTLTSRNLSNDELFLFHKLVEVLQYTKISRSFLTRIFAEFEDAKRFADVMYADLRHPQQRMFAFHATRFMNWKVQAAFAQSHILLWSFTAVTSLVNWPAIIQILAWIPKFLLITVPSSIIGDHLSSLLSLVYAQPIWTKIVGSVSEQMTIYQEVSTTNSSATASPLITQDILYSGYFPARFQNIIFRDATEFVEKTSTSITISVSTNLLITIGFSSLLCGFVGRFPRLQGVQTELRPVYLKHKLYHDFFTSWANRQTDFWCYFFTQLFRNFSTSTWLGNVLLAVLKIVSHHAPLWLTAFVTGKGKYNPISVLMLPEETVQSDLSQWSVLAFYVSMLYTIKECVTNHYMYDQLFCTDETQTNCKNETHKVRVVGSRKKHQSPKWYHVATSVAMNVSICALRWHFYFNQPEHVSSSKNAVFGGLLDAGTWLHFGKLIGCEFLIRGSASLVEYIFSK
jgi:hypothetical protein